MNKKQFALVAGIVILIIVAAVILTTRNKETIPKTSNKSSWQAAQAFLVEGKLIEAREIYKELRSQESNANQLKKLQEKIEEVNTKIIFSQAIGECSSEYIVKPRDALSKIAKRFNTTVGLIKKGNRLSSDIIRPKQRLKVNICPFSIAIDKSQNLLFLKRKNEVVRTYIVATGKDNGTPVGNFKITNKLEKPTWYRTGAVIPPDSPDNVLGSRWMGFDLKGYGIHGTTEPNHLGKQITLGCIRMHNQDVEELFDIVPVGTEVIIVD